MNNSNVDKRNSAFNRTNNYSLVNRPVSYKGRKGEYKAEYSEYDDGRFEFEVLSAPDGKEDKLQGYLLLKKPKNLDQLKAAMKKYDEIEAKGNSMQAKKLAIIKSNTTQKVASGNYRGAKWTMWKSRDAMFSAEPFGVEIMLEMGTRKESYIRAAAGKTPEEALQKAKKRADEEIARWDKMHPNDPYKNSLEAKQLAIIKSNAAPEVKLKALEKLDEKKNAKDPKVTMAAKQLDRALDEMERAYPVLKYREIKQAIGLIQEAVYMAYHEV